MNPIIKHLAIPAFVPMAIIALYFTPKEVFGCANRGYLALGVVLLATIGAMVCTAKGVALQRQGSQEVGWWLASTLILLAAVLLLFGPLG